MSRADSPFLRVDLAGVFRGAVELGLAHAAPASGSLRPGGGGSVASIHNDLLAEGAASDRLVCALNPWLSRVPEWSRRLAFEDVPPAARLALLTLGLAVADIRGGVWDERGRALLDAGTRHLWTALGADEHKAVRDLLPDTLKLWGWPENPADDPGEYREPVATLEDPRVIDQLNWRTVTRHPL
jgi:hypothetical protein